MDTENANITYDDQVWELLNLNRTGWNGYDEKEDTIWPCNRKEISATKKVLKSIDYERLTETVVIEEYHAQVDLAESMLKELPNNRVKMIVPLLIMLGLIYFYFWYAHPPKASHYDPQDWVLTLTTEFVSSSDRNPNIELKRKNIARGTTVTPLAMAGQQRVKVKLPSGEIGYIAVAAFSGVNRNSEIVNGTQLFPKQDNSKEIGKIEKDMPTIIGIPKIDDEKNHYLKVRTSKGNVGYIFGNHIKYHFTDSLPKINSDNVLPVASNKAIKWNGQSMDEIEERYGPASAFMNNWAYWSNVRIIADTLAYGGVMSRVNEEGRIDSVQFGAQEKLYMSIKFVPIWRMIASVEPMYGIANMYYKQNDRELNIAWWQKLRTSHWTVRFVTWIIKVILKVIWFLLQLSILFLPVMALGIIISHLERPGYLTSINVALWLSVFVLLYVCVFTLLQNALEPVVIVILLLAAIANLTGFYNHLHAKCSRCGNWHGEITENTDFLGSSVSVQYGTRDKFLGSDTKLTGVSHSASGDTKTYNYLTTKRYERVKTRDTYNYDNYEDHKMCKYCGKRWKERFKILRCEKHEEY